MLTIISKIIQKIWGISYDKCDRVIYQRLDGGGFDLRSGIRGDYKGVYSLIERYSQKDHTLRKKCA